MSDDIFLTLSQLARAGGVDRRRKLLQGFQPDGFLQLGSKRIPIFKNGPFLLARLSAAGGTAGVKMPLPQPEVPIQTETGKS
jgi:hypothetical protein